MKIINATAPVRICDNGGWTDTWFAEHGAVFNMAVTPGAEVQIEVHPAGSLPDRVMIQVENYGDNYPLDPEGERPGKHSLLEATVELMGVPASVAIRINIFSSVPPGASTGTSAAAVVALIGALSALTPGCLTPHEVAYKAHAVEVNMLGRECGVQDQLCSAYGGVNYIEIFNYPYAAVSPIHLPREIWWELDQRLALIYLGEAHDSSALHEQVIHRLKEAGPDAPPLQELRQIAKLTRDALYASNFAALGEAMIANTEAQSQLHPNLVGDRARHVIEIARAHGTLGWKVNGAGGSGGSLTLLCSSSASLKRRLLREIEEENRLFRHIPISLSRHGLRVWEGETEPG